MSHEQQHLLSALEELGKYLGCNRDIYYTLALVIGIFLDLIMESVLPLVKKTIKQFNKNNLEKGIKVKCSVWKRTNVDFLCRVLITHIPDNFTIDKFILLYPSLDICEEMKYFIDDIVTSFYRIS